MNIVIAGTGAACLQTLRLIIKLEHHVTAVLSHPEPYKFRGANLVTTAKKLAIPVWPGTLVKDPRFASTLQAHTVDLLLSINSLYVVCAEVLAAVRVGAFNLHPSLLPRYAGLNPVAWAILRGEKSHGVTIHWMESRIDTGAIAYQHEFPVADTDTYGTVFFQCTKYGIQLLERLLRDATFDAGHIPRIPQDLTKRTKFGAGPPYQASVPWAIPADAIRNFLRACENRPFPAPWGHPRTRLNGREVGLVTGYVTGRATNQQPGTVGEISEVGAMIACGDQWLLVTEICVDGVYFPLVKQIGAHNGLQDIIGTVASGIR